jgi:hypothetical protein
MSQHKIITSDKSKSSYDPHTIMSEPFMKDQKRTLEGTIQRETEFKQTVMTEPVRVKPIHTEEKHPSVRSDLSVRSKITVEESDESDYNRDYNPNLGSETKLVDDSSKIFTRKHNSDKISDNSLKHPTTSPPELSEHSKDFKRRNDQKCEFCDEFHPFVSTDETTQFDSQYGCPKKSRQNTVTHVNDLSDPMKVTISHKVESKEELKLLILLELSHAQRNITEIYKSLI